MNEEALAANNILPSVPGSGDDRAVLCAGLEALATPLVLLDREARVVYLTGAATRLLGMDLGDAVDRAWPALWVALSADGGALSTEGQRTRLRRGAQVIPVRAWQRAVRGTPYQLVGLEDLSAEDAQEREVLRIFRDVQQQADDLFALYQITQFLNTAQELDQLCAIFLRELTHLTGAERACLYLAAPPDGLQPQGWHALPTAPPPQPDSNAAAIWFTAQAEGHTVLVLPLLAEEREVGLALLAHPGTVNREMRFLRTVAKAMGSALLLMAERQMKADFLVTVSHQLRTPLALLRGYSDTLLHLDLAPHEQRACVNGIVETTSRMEQLVAQVLEVTRIEDGRLELHRERVRLVDIVRTALTALPQTAYRSRIWAELAPDLPPIYADPQRLEQVLINLLDNALKYSPPSGQVLIRAQPVGDMVRVQVLDEGMGIPDQERAAIFDKFRRASNVRNSHIPGNGLGLFICRSIIAAHGGEIVVESPAAAGTCITFSLPLAAKGA